jgi:hypothetical protein
MWTTREHCPTWRRCISIERSDSNGEKQNRARIKTSHGMRFRTTVLATESLLSGFNRHAQWIHFIGWWFHRLQMKMQEIQFKLISNLIRMKWLKVIDNIENDRSQDFAFESICDQEIRQSLCDTNLRFPDSSQNSRNSPSKTLNHQCIQLLAESQVIVEMTLNSPNPRSSGMQSERNECEWLHDSD